MNNTVKTLLSFFAVAFYIGINFISNSVQTLIVGQQAGGQLENSNSAYIGSIAGMQLGSHFGISLLVLLVVLALIWWKNIKSMLGIGTTAIILIAVMTAPSYAYYDKNDYTEAYTILPNESAFWIPDVGANKDSQAKMNSEDYYNANKVALKRFVVPHTKLQGSGTFFDYYVPAGRLIIVDRTPYSREWVDASDRGTSASKQGFPCQSKEGLNITAGVSIGASVSEDNAAKYLYHFGVAENSKVNRNDPQIIFQSVYYSRKLADVMDDVGRKKVQTLVCNEIGKLGFDQANQQMIPIMDAVQKLATDYFASVGITLDFIGWADTFTFDKEVQNSIDHRYASIQEAANLQLLAPYADVISAIASSEAVQTFASKSDGKLPTTMTNVGVPPEIGTLLRNLFIMKPTGAGSGFPLPEKAR